MNMAPVKAYLFPGRKLRIWGCPWTPDVRLSLSAKHVHPSTKTTILIMLVCPLKMELLYLEKLEFLNGKLGS